MLAVARGGLLLRLLLLRLLIIAALPAALGFAFALVGSAAGGPALGYLVAPFAAIGTITIERLLAALWLLLAAAFFVALNLRTTGAAAAAAAARSKKASSVSAAGFATLAPFAALGIVDGRRLLSAEERAGGRRT